MMSSIRHMHRVIAVLLIALWGAVGIVAPAHAAEEDIHHAIQHDGAGEMMSADPVQGDKDNTHPEHAAHCYPSGCHCHVVSRATMDPAAIQLAAGKLIVLANAAVRQTSLSSLFRPPRI